MRLLSFEHSPAAYLMDFVVYAAAVAALAAWLLRAGPAALALPLVATVLAGGLAWTLLEYLLHRFVLHGLRPFRLWHAEHHARPTALICAPTALSSTLVAGLVFLPMLLLSNRWFASAFTLGLLIGYLTYSLTHNLLHHGRAGSAWWRERRQWHRRHHQAGAAPACYGVTTGFWDHVFRSVPARRSPPP